MTQPQNPDQTHDAVSRVIVLIYGQLANGNPFWCFVAVRPSQYKEFLAAQKESRLNLTQFENYGEIIIAGEGTSPPDEVTLKVAEVYQTDPTKFFQPIDNT